MKRKTVFAVKLSFDEIAGLEALVAEQCRIVKSLNPELFSYWRNTLRKIKEAI